MLKTIVQSLFTRGAVAGINLLILILSSRYLGVSSRGEISIFILNISIVQIITGIYSGYSVIHFVPKFSLKKLLIEGIVFTVLVAALGNLAIVMLRKQVPGYEWWGYAVSVLVILNTFNCFVLLGRQHVRAFNLLSLMQPALLLAGIAFWVLILKVYTFQAYLFPLLLSFLVAFAASSASVYKLTPLMSGSETYRRREVIVNGLYFQGAQLLFIFINRFSYYLLPGKALLGLYSSAVTFTEAILIIANGLAPVIASKVANRGEPHKHWEMSLALCKLSLCFSVAALALLLGLPESIFTGVLGKGFSGIKTLMLFYAPGVLAASAFIPLTSYFSALGRQKTVLLAYALGCLFTLLVAPTLISAFGAKGAALTTGLAYVVILLVMLVVFARGNKISLKRLLRLRLDDAGLEELIPVSD